MAVHEGHVLNIDASAVPNNITGGSKYNPVSSERVTSGVGRGSLFETDDVEGVPADRVSVFSGASGRSKTTSQLEAAAKLPWYRGVTCKDIRDIMPTLLILLGGLLIMIFVIPYAFSSVIKQLEAEQIMEKAKADAALAEANATYYRQLQEQDQLQEDVPPSYDYETESK
ncbi:hypothetical protein TCAL_17321 [Tigriopus californicus]|uniref:Uncharacterized protein n=2 Tax=Tigriopus californicus TaxID=6832 RepID=A0A553P0P6_TIGCA|nr:uncharacterized protein LOC131886626 isoform X2 [Tigriopus californicus]TRY71182.1 hypothetical protein TCAL_17321 [Tigriopus californicus]